MKKFLLLASLFSCVVILYAQDCVIDMAGRASSSSYSIGGNESFTSNGNIRLLTIGIGSFEEKKHFDYLHSFKELNNFKKAVKYLNQSKYVYPPHLFNKSTVNLADVRRELENLYQESNKSDVVIISILSHGAVENNEYYLVCSDTKMSDYNGTALSGTELRSLVQRIANKGVLVLLFLDTCHSAALFKGKEDDIKKGSIAIYASADSSETAKEIEFKSYFSKTITEIFTGVHDVYGNHEYATLSSIASQVSTSLGNVKDNIGRQYQHPVALFPNKNIAEFQLFNKATKVTIPWSVYLGPSFGTNFKTPYANLTLGVAINNQHKIEVGFTHSLTKSDEVYIYDNNRILQNALQYKAMSFYARYGFNWLSLCKEKSRSEFVTFAGLSGNIVNGDNLSGFSSSIGKSAGSLMGNFCCRWAWDFSKENKRNVLLHITAGLDFPLKRDGNVSNVLIDEKYIKNWCTFRPYVEAGFIFNILKF